MLCSVCGTENNSTANYCEQCGAKLNDNKSTDKKNNSTKKVSKKNSSSKKNANTSKAIDPVKLVYVILALVVIGGAILYASGIFDQPSTPAVNQLPADDFHRGADLTKLQEINSLRDAVVNNPKDHESTLHLAHLLNDSGFKEEAIKWYRQYLTDHGAQADVWIDMGVCYFDSNDFESAISAMKKGIELNPQHQIGHFNLGIVNFTKGNLTEAIDWWNKAIALNPSSDIASRARELIKNNTNM